MRKLGIMLAVLLAGVAMAAPAGAAKKPPPTDDAAAALCEHMQLLDNERENHVAPVASDYETLLDGLGETGSKGATALHDQLSTATTGKARAAALRKISNWCRNTLQLRCGTFQCKGGNRVTTVPTTA